MARLIDADKLLTQVRQIDFLKMPNSTKLCASEIMMMINKQPTAYDLEKVVKELENKKNEYLEGFRIHDNDEMYGVACGFGDSIEIVRKGGVK